MSARVPSIFQKTDVLPDQLTLWVGGKIFEGWEDLQFTRELNSCASDFQMKLTDKWREDKEAWRVTANQHAHIHIGKNSMLEGYIDAVDASVSANARAVTVKGRSKTCDLVDCSITGENQLPNLNLKDIATKVCAPFSIPVIFNADPGDVFANTTIQSGETVFALLDRLARQRKLLIYPSSGGSLVFTKAGGKRASTQLVEGVNVLSGKSSYDFTNRFSEYTAKGQNIGWMGDDAKKSSAALGTATDEGVGRYRPLVLNNEAVSDDGASDNRAAYEAALRKAQSLKVEIQTQGFYQKDGTLWDINQFVFVDCGFLGVRRWMIVRKVTYNKSIGGGTTTTLDLCLPDSFNFDKVKKKEDALGWSKPLVNKAPVKDK